MSVPARCRRFPHCAQCPFGRPRDRRRVAAAVENQPLRRPGRSDTPPDSGGTGGRRRSRCPAVGRRGRGRIEMDAECRLLGDPAVAAESLAYATRAAPRSESSALGPSARSTARERDPVGEYRHDKAWVLKPRVGGSGVVACDPAASPKRKGPRQGPRGPDGPPGGGVRVFAPSFAGIWRRRAPMI